MCRKFIRTRVILDVMRFEVSEIVETTPGTAYVTIIVGSFTSPTLPSSAVVYVIWTSTIWLQYVDVTREVRVSFCRRCNFKRLKL